jgi:hypothetical protein
MYNLVLRIDWRLYWILVVQCSGKFFSLRAPYMDDMCAHPLAN